MNSQPKLAAIAPPAPALESDSVILRLRNAKGREVVGDRVIVRVVADLIFEAPDAAGYVADPGQVAVAEHLLSDMGTQSGKIRPAGLGLRLLGPSETTIGYDPAITIIFGEKDDSWRSLGGGAE